METMVTATRVKRQRRKSLAELQAIFTKSSGHTDPRTNCEWGTRKGNFKLDSRLHNRLRRQIETDPSSG